MWSDTPWYVTELEMLKLKYKLPILKMAANNAPVKNIYRLFILKKCPATPRRSLATISVAPPIAMMFAISA